VERLGDAQRLCRCKWHIPNIYRGMKNVRHCMLLAAVCTSCCWWQLQRFKLSEVTQQPDISPSSNPFAKRKRSCPCCWALGQRGPPLESAASL
jgi:hypothetical protein